MSKRFKNAPITNKKEFSFVSEDADKLSLIKLNNIQDVYILFFLTGNSKNWKDTYKYIHQNISSLSRLKEGVSHIIDDYQI